jgi:hypothetical protein
LQVGHDHPDVYALDGHANSGSLRGRRLLGVARSHGAEKKCGHDMCEEFHKGRQISVGPELVTRTRRHSRPTRKKIRRRYNRRTASPTGVGAGRRGPYRTKKMPPRRLVEPLFEVEAFGIFPGGGEGGMQVAGEDLGIDLFEPGGHGCGRCGRGFLAR